MSKARLKRLEEALQPNVEVPRPRIPATREERRAWLAETLPALCRKAFGVGDPRADPAYLAGLTLKELYDVYRQVLEKEIADWAATNPPQREAFRRLPLSEKVRILRTDYRNWPAELK